MRDHAIATETLKAGMARLGPSFRARICWACDGEGRYEQMYTAGCGQGYFRSLGDCDHCAGCGLVQGNAPAPKSIVAQVVQAGLTAAETV
jgi:hypothetical protein